MGTYLSTPVTEKHSEQGDAIHCTVSPVQWGVVDMQGWRKSMEDAHLADTNVPIPTTTSLAAQQQHQTDDPTSADNKENCNNDDCDVNAKVFAVFDGHGGPEVARFCSLYLVSVLQQQPTWKQQRLQSSNGNSNYSDDDNSIMNQSKTTPVGQALVSTFHALDRMIDDPKRRDELYRLRATKPQPGERRTAEYIPTTLHCNNYTETSVAPTSTQMNNANENPNPAQDDEDEDDVDNEDSNNNSNPQGISETTIVGDATTTAEQESDKSDCDGPSDSSQDEAQQESDDKNKSSESEDDDSQEVVGKEEAAALDQFDDCSDDDDSIVTATANDNNDAAEKDKDAKCDPQETEGNPENLEQTDVVVEVTNSDPTHVVSEPPSPATAAGKVSVMFQRLLNISGPSGQIVMQVSPNNNAAPIGGLALNAAATSPVAAPSLAAGPSASSPTLVRNGRLICNLPDHPVHAGATAIVAVLVGRTLTVANAGDSRAVLCRGPSCTATAGAATALSLSSFRTLPLSVDHKPFQDEEMGRIKRAGGFVNSFGRVNGNLNLSRSIGDLKYKQVPGIPPAEQMITAEPDIVQIRLNDDDEFIILGCDGIWDCLTNEKAVEYVRSRIDIKHPTEIGKEMLDEIISDDPRVSQGIGGDNMTIMIIDLRPTSRSRFQTAKAANQDGRPTATPNE